MAIGGGPASTLMDDSLWLIRRYWIVCVDCRTGKDPYQFRRYTGSFTDAGAVALAHSGAAVGVISTPCRYIHTPVSLLSLEDWNHLVNIIDLFIRSVSEKGI